MMEKFVYRLESTKPFDTVVDNIVKQTPDHKFRVLHIHDVQATLAEKGLERGPLKIIEVCNAKYAHEALQKEIGVSLFMPCRYSVFEEGGKTIVMLAKPTMISEMMPKAGLESFAGEVEAVLIKIMKASV